MLKRLLKILVLVNLINSQLVLAQASWPKADSLSAFWPLSGYYKLRDVSGNALDGTALSGSYAWTGAGPFGDASTAYSSSANVFEVTNAKAAEKLSLANLTSFTISFFLRATYSGNYGILQFLTGSSLANTNALSINLQSNGLYLAGGTLTSNALLLPNVVNNNIWNYYALVFTTDSTKNNCTVSVYGRFGQIYKARSYPAVCTAQQHSIGGVRLGPTATYAGNWNSYIITSCLMIYSTALSENEIMQNYESCRSALSGAQCGTPRLAISQLPQIPVAPARAGQFPWVASLRYRNLPSSGSIVCSATIVTPYWLLTAASCFGGQLAQHPSNYYIYVGEYDLAVTETFEKRHDIKNIYFNFKPYTTFYDIALIELTAPIDFSNPYVNEACIPTDDSLYQSTAPSFAIGWGQGGRNSLASQTAIRYTSGTITNSSICMKSWIEQGSKNDPVFCYLGQPDPSAPCTGDGGSPLGLTVYSKLVQVGIYSTRGSDCSSTTTKYPLFTRVAKFWPWMKPLLSCINPGSNYPTECPMP